MARMTLQLVFLAMESCYIVLFSGQLKSPSAPRAWGGRLKVLLVNSCGPWLLWLGLGKGVLPTVEMRAIFRWVMGPVQGHLLDT